MTDVEVALKFFIMFCLMHNCSCTNSKQYIVPISPSYENCWHALSFYAVLNIYTPLTLFLHSSRCHVCSLLQFSCHNFLKNQSSRKKLPKLHCCLHTANAIIFAHWSHTFVKFVKRNVSFCFKKSVCSSSFVETTSKATDIFEIAAKIAVPLSALQKQ